MEQTVVQEVTVQELVELKQKQADFQLIDVREPSEYDVSHIQGTLIPLGQLADRIGELDPKQLIIVHCKSGGRSTRAVQFLQSQGFTNVKNLKGGITAWRNEIDPTLPG
jgi:rhodanese-related sulfurtransferase